MTSFAPEEFAPEEFFGGGQICNDELPSKKTRNVNFDCIMKAFFDHATNRYKFGENASPHNLHKKNCCNLNLGEGLCIVTFFLFSGSGLKLLNGFGFYFDPFWMAWKPAILMAFLRGERITLALTHFSPFFFFVVVFTRQLRLPGYSGYPIWVLGLPYFLPCKHSRLG